MRGSRSRKPPTRPGRTPGHAGAATGSAPACDRGAGRRTPRKFASARLHVGQPQHVREVAPALDRDAEVVGGVVDEALVRRWPLQRVERAVELDRVHPGRRRTRARGAARAPGDRSRRATRRTSTPTRRPGSRPWRRRARSAPPQTAVSPGRRRSGRAARRRRPPPGSRPGTTRSRSARSSEARNGDAAAWARSAAATASRSGSPRWATPPPSTTVCGSTARLSARTASATPAANRSRTSIAFGSPAAAAANSACAGGRRPTATRPPARAGGDGLQAAALAALAGRAGRVDGEVPDLAGGAVLAAAQPTVEHQPGGQAGADAEVDEVVLAAERDRAERRGVDVVLDDDRHAEPVGEQAAQRAASRRRRRG